MLFSRQQREKMRRANRRHEEILAELATTLRNRGHLVDEGQLIDAFARSKSGPAIFEVKSLGEGNERSQVRSAISQLYEYRFLHDLKDVTLWLVLSRSQSEGQEWMMEYLREDRDVWLLWVHDGELRGPDRSRLTASGTEARHSG